MGQGTSRGMTIEIWINKSTKIIETAYSKGDSMMINLIINPDSIRLSKSKVSGQIFSEIYFIIQDDTFFPEKGWDDFSEVIMGWWLERSLEIRKGSKTVLNFMDGPYYLEITESGENYTILFISDKYNERNIIYSEKINKKLFLKLLLKSANLLIRNIPDEAKKLADVLVLINNFKLLQ
jgi:hypothetical protein